MIPYGYRIGKAKALIDPEEKEKLFRLFKAYAAGMRLKDCIAKAGIEKSAPTCKSMLSNRDYLGTDFFPQIISEDLFDEVQVELGRRKRPPKFMPKKSEVLKVYTGFTATKEKRAVEDPKERAVNQFNRIKPVW